MRGVKKILSSPIFWLVFAGVLYFAGFILIDNPDSSYLSEAQFGGREVAFVADHDGEVYLSESSDVEALGRVKVFTYQDVYLFSIPLLFASLIIGGIIFNGGVSTSRMDIKHAIFANCMLGLLIIDITSKENIPSTVLFWLGIFTAGISLMFDKKEYNQEE